MPGLQSPISSQSHSNTTPNTFAMATTSASLKEVLMTVAIVVLSTGDLASGHRFLSARDHTCSVSGYLRGKENLNSCNPKHADCCMNGRSYPQYRCSPPVTGSTGATMTVNNFAAGGDGGDPSECDGQYHDNRELVVALSTGWYAGGRRCRKNIRINANGKSVIAKVVDECDSVNGCDQEHDYQRPCHNNVVDASPAVWEALQIPRSEGEYHITWSDA